MTNPLLSDSVQHPVITQRLEQDNHQECFKLDYSVPFSARLRLCVGSLQYPLLKLMFWLLLPLLAMNLYLVVALFQESRRKPRVVTMQLFEWGIHHSTLRFTWKWEEITRVFAKNGDTFICRKTQVCSVPREAFDGAEHAQQFYEVAENLWRSQGKSWDSTKTLFGVK